VQYGDAVGVADGGNAVGDEDGGASLHDFAEVVEDFVSVWVSTLERASVDKTLHHRDTGAREKSQRALVPVKTQLTQRIYFFIQLALRGCIDLNDQDSPIRLRNRDGSVVVRRSVRLPEIEPPNGVSGRSDLRWTGNLDSSYIHP